MDLEQFLFRSGTHSGALNSRHCNQDPLDGMRELARRGLKLFPVSMAAKLAGDPDRWITDATDDISLLEDLSTAPLWGYRLALGPSGLCVLILDGAVGRASFAALAPDLEGCLTLQACRGDVMYPFFRQPTGMKRIASASKLAPGVSILGHDAGFDVPPAGGAIWVNPGAEIEALPYVLRELFASDPPDSPPGRAMPAPKLSPRPAPCRSTERLVHRHREVRKGFPNCNQARWNGGYRIYRQR